MQAVVITMPGSRAVCGGQGLSNELLDERAATTKGHTPPYPLTAVPAPTVTRSKRARHQSPRRSNSAECQGILGHASPRPPYLVLAVHHLCDKEAPPRHREAVIFRYCPREYCPREEIRGGLSRGLSRTRMARRSLVQRGQVE
jgi:hypothetical protein